MKSNHLKPLLLMGLLLVLGQHAEGQSFYKKQLSLLNWGYGRTTVSFKYEGAPPNKAGIGHSPLTFEYFSRNAYFHSDLLTPMVDLCMGAFSRQFWYGHERDGYVYNGGDWPLARLAFGGYIGNRVGLYLGGQWGYSKWRMAPGEYVDGKLEYSINLETEVGGHTFGPGVHAVLDFNRLMVRNSLMYDFVNEGMDGPIYTRTLTWDGMLVYRLSNRLGGFLNYVLSPGRSDIRFSKFRIGLSILFAK